MSKGIQPTAEQLALAEERRRKKEERSQAAAKEEEQKSRILSREWTTVQDAPAPEREQGIRVMTWNLLAQCLVRRELFPTSNCLKAGQREHMLYPSHEAIQEVDRLEKLCSILDNAGYSWVYAAGPRKKHGCLIAYKKDMFMRAGERVIQYDEQNVRQDERERARRGSSFRTKNIASLVRLVRRGEPSNGVVVATTHLFWHPSYTYERARQAAILLREVAKFRDEIHVDGPNWPCIIAGDFNFQPDDPAYSLLVGDSLLAPQDQKLDASRVVHVTIDPDVPVSSDAAVVEEEGAEVGETDPDRTITNARRARPEDGLLSGDELARMCREAGTLASLYEEGQRLAASLEANLTFGSRVPIAQGRHGAFEPVWTSYTHYWKSVLDYIFVLLPRSRSMVITRIAKPHTEDVLKPGLPQQGVCASDHISLGAELYLST